MEATCEEMLSFTTYPSIKALALRILAATQYSLSAYDAANDTLKRLFSVLSGTGESLLAMTSYYNALRVFLRSW